MTKKPKEPLRGETLLLAVAIIVGGVVIGQIVASAVDVSGVSRILVSGAAIFVLTWAVGGLLMLRLQIRRKARQTQERVEHPRGSRSGGR